MSWTCVVERGFSFLMACLSSCSGLLLMIVLGSLFGFQDTSEVIDFLSVIV